MKFINDIYCRYQKEHGKAPRVITVSPTMFAAYKRTVSVMIRVSSTPKTDQIESAVYKLARIVKAPLLKGREYGVGGPS